MKGQGGIGGEVKTRAASGGSLESCNHPLQVYEIADVLIQEARACVSCGKTW